MRRAPGILFARIAVAARFTRVVLDALGALGAFTVLAALLGCAPKTTAVAIERVELGPPPSRVADAEIVRISRAGHAELTSDTRDAWTIPIGSDALVELAVHSGTKLRIASACGVELRDRARAASGRVRLALAVRSGGAHLERKLEPGSEREGDLRPERKLDLYVEREFDLADFARAWTPLALDVDTTSRTVELELSAHWVGTSPGDASSVRAAFELPAEARSARHSPSGETSSARCNVLIISVDTLRADRLGCYGNTRGLTPNIDHLAARGVRFANAYSSAPWTLPSYGSLFTGLLPGEHRAGVVTEREALFGRDEDAPAKLATERLRSDVPTLAESFAAAGWATAMFHANPYLARASGLDRGFERYAFYGVNARNGVDFALEWIDEPRSSPFFLVLHLMDPHYPYAPPAPYDERFAGRSVDTLSPWPPSLAKLRQARPANELAKLCEDLYDGEVAFSDAEIGRLLDALEARGLTSRTLVVLHSDHGEEFWEHGSCDHGHAQHEELLRVPLVIALPRDATAGIASGGSAPGDIASGAIASGGVAPRGAALEGRRVEARVRALDLFPTLCELCGLPRPARLDGASLVPLFRAEGEPRDVLAEAVHTGAREIKALIAGRFKLVARGASGDRLYDLSVTARENDDCAEREPDRARELRARLMEHHTRSLAAGRNARPLENDAETRERLSRLGYAGDADSQETEKQRAK